MEFGKIHDPDSVNWFYPEENWHNLSYIGSADNRNDEPKILYIGATSWTENNWKNKWYPAKCTPADFLIYYSRQFNTIELNTSFYQIPPSNTIYKWLEKTPDYFRFCPKIFQGISRSLSKIDYKIFDDLIRMLHDFKPKLGSCFLQLPETFTSDRSAILIDFLKEFPKDFDLAVEFRHPSWFGNINSTVFAEMEKLGKHSVITDVGGRRDVCHLLAVGKSVMIRFVGNNMHQTDLLRINKWIEIMKYWFLNGVQKIYFFIHEPENNFTPELAHYLGRIWEETTDIATNYPKMLDNTDKQMTLF